MSNRIESRIVPARSLDDRQLTEMYALFERYYKDVNEVQFRADLAEKTHVFVFRERRSGDLVGFSTIFRKKLPQVGKGTFLYSGDTVLREDYWGSKILQSCFFRYIVESKVLSPASPVYWMLISKGFKTYMMMRRNFSRSWPRHGDETPAHIRDVMAKFYRWKFGSAFDPGTGLIRFDSSKGAVKGEIAAPSGRQLEDTDVKFFLKANPEYQDGVELACITEIRFEDFLGHVPKYFIGKKSKKETT